MLPAGNRCAKGDVRWKFVMNVKSASEKSVDYCGYLFSKSSVPNSSKNIRE